MREQRMAWPAAGSGSRETPSRWAEQVTSGVLRIGVLLSAAIVIIGVLMFYVRYAANRADVRRFPHSLAAVMHGLANGDARSVIVLGLLVLLATPVLRVAVSIFTFALERDWRYVVISSIVLGVLVVSFFLGRGGA